MGCKSRGQVATEYLIILGIVIVISLIVVGVLRSFIELRPGIETATSKIEWASQDVVLTAHTVYSSGTAVLILMNNLDYPIQITQVGVGKTPVSLASNVRIESGRQATIQVPSAGVASGVPDESYTLTVTIKYEHAEESAIKGTVKGTIYGLYES